MATPLPDRIVEFLRGCGEEGATTEEIAEHVLAARGQRAAWQAVLDKLLQGHDRVKRSPCGRWAVKPEPQAPAACGFTVIETLILHPPGGAEWVLECAATRLPPGGGADSLASLIRPEGPLPPAVKLPAGMRRADLTSAPPREELLPTLRDFAAGTTLVTFGRSALVSALAARMDPGDTLFLQKLHRLLTGTAAPKSLQALAGAWEVFCPDEPRAERRTAVAAEIFALMRSEAEAQGHANLTELLNAGRARHRPDFDRYGFGPEFLAALPKSPGAYIMRDAGGAALYVGKASNLHSRVRSYFRPKVRRDEKDQRLLEAVHRIDIQEAGSELEALLLEHRLIHELQPPINLQYQVHERPVGYARGENVILILPSAKDRCAELFLIKGEERFSQLRVPLRRPSRARRPIERMYFSRAPGKATDHELAALEIAWSWLARHRDDLNMIKVDTAAGQDDLMRLLRDHLAEDPLQGRRVYRV